MCRPQPRARCLMPSDLLAAHEPISNLSPADEQADSIATKLADWGIGNIGPSRIANVNVHSGYPTNRHEAKDGNMNATLTSPPVVAAPSAVSCRGCQTLICSAASFLG